MWFAKGRVACGCFLIAESGHPVPYLNYRREGQFISAFNFPSIVPACHKVVHQRYAIYAIPCLQDLQDSQSTSQSTLHYTTFTFAPSTTVASSQCVIVFTCSAFRFSLAACPKPSAFAQACPARAQGPICTGSMVPDPF